MNDLTIHLLKTNLRRYFFLALLGTIISSCANFEEPEFRGSEGIKLEKLEGKKVSFTASGKVYNPNWFGIKIKPSNLEVYIEDQFIGKIFLQKKVKMKAKSESSLSFPLIGELEDGAMITILRYANKDKVEVRLKGKVKGGIWFFSKKFEIDETRSVSGKSLKLN